MKSVRSRRLGFVINPVAGMGGRVGLKGTDDVVEQALELGATPSAGAKAMDTLVLLERRLHAANEGPRVRWLSCAGEMGEDCLRASGFDELEIAHHGTGSSTAADTKAAARAFLSAEVELIVFCGGDGTARDICAVVDCKVPILGIPAGVKMYSGVFGVSVRSTAEIVYQFLRGEVAVREADVLDLDEAQYRRGEWVVRLYDQAMTPYEPVYTQAAKMVVAEGTDEEIKEEIAAFLSEEMHREPEVVWILGAGSTLEALGKLLGVQKSLLGIDAVVGGQLIGSDLNEAGLLDLLSQDREARLILSPIGAQGFVLGRGNSPLSPKVLRLIGPRNVRIVATPAKLVHTPVLRFDTGDAALDADLAGPGYLPVTVGYGRRRLVKVRV